LRRLWGRICTDACLVCCCVSLFLSSVLSNEVFDSVSGYIIIDKALCGKIITGSVMVSYIIAMCWRITHMRLSINASVRAADEDCRVSRLHRRRQVPSQCAALQHWYRCFLFIFEKQSSVCIFLTHVYECMYVILLCRLCV
jgi:hypothetical protein